MPAPQSVDRETFLVNLRQSGLLTDEQMAAAAEQELENDRGRVLARTLVRQGLLTKFQAEQLLAGRVHGFLLGQYRIFDQIGQGGMGRVFKAQHNTLDRVVALKVLSPRLMRNERAQELFRREARAVARLIHPNIVTAYDANQVGTRWFLVMEYVDGPNLHQFVEKQGPLPVGLACDLVRQAAAGLQYAFSLGLVHRDIKPANLLLQRRGSDGLAAHGVVKITDFGLARLTEGEPRNDPTKDAPILGTPDYVAPEQARDVHLADVRSDLYSLGCTFYYLLAGEVPFPGGTTMDKLVRHGTEQPIPLQALRSDVPAEVAAVVYRLMAKDPAARFQTPAELTAALAPFAVSGPVPWADPRSTDPFLDSGPSALAPPGSRSEFSIHPSTWDDASALAGTVSPDGSPTPHSVHAAPARPRTAAQVLAEEQRRLRTGLLAAAGLGGLILLVILIRMLF